MQNRSNPGSRQGTDSSQLLMKAKSVDESMTGTQNKLGGMLASSFK
jgi:hypothetical protein